MRGDFYFKLPQSPLRYLDFSMNFSHLPMHVTVQHHPIALSRASPDHMTDTCTQAVAGLLVPAALLLTAI
jgi:hypothetical protein